MDPDAEVRDLDRPKRLKVRVSKEIQLQLHAHKILRDTTMAEMVQEALDLHFEEVFEENIHLDA